MGVGSCPAASSLGDAYLWLELSSSTSVPRGIRRYALGSGGTSLTPVEVINLEGLYDTQIHFSLSGENADTLAIYCGDLYATLNNEGNSVPRGYLIKVTGDASHTATVLYDFFGAPFGDAFPTDITFDDRGNVYVLLQRAGFSTDRLVVWKLSPTGTLLHRYLLSPSRTNQNGSEWIWLASDNRTLYYSYGPATDQSRIAMWDVVSDVSLGNYTPVLTPFFLPHHWEACNGILLSDGSIIVPQKGAFAPDTAGARHFSAAGVLLNTYTYTPAGFQGNSYDQVDMDPDGSHVWFSDITGGTGTGAAVGKSLVKWDIAGTTFTKVAILDELGLSPIRPNTQTPSTLGYTDFAMAICGGAGHRESNLCAVARAGFRVSAALIT